MPATFSQRSALFVMALIAVLDTVSVDAGRVNLGDLPVPHHAKYIDHYPCIGSDGGDRCEGAYTAQAVNLRLPESW